MEADDVPCPIDYQQLAEARAWADAASTLRPWRTDFFALSARTVAKAANGMPWRVLDLGSGPGFLAEQLLRAAPGLQYVGLDQSAAMHALARERLGPQSGRAQLVQRSFKEPAWADGLGSFDVVVTHQAVHELRHRRHASTLHAQAASLLRDGGLYLVCDHYLGEGGMANAELYMTADEQRNELLAAGFADVECLLLQGDMVLHQARL